MTNIEPQVAAELITGSLNWRYATKQYDPARRLSDTQRTAIKNALRLAPSSFGLEAWKFIHPTDPKLREDLRAAAYGQSPLTEASDIFILAAYKSIDEKFVKEFIELTAKTQGVAASTLQDYEKSIVGSVVNRTPADLQAWLACQVYIPLGSALLAAAELGVDATPMEGFDSKKFNEILGLDKLNLNAKAILALGFRAASDTYQKLPKVRWTESEAFLNK
jgi:nitroreductase